MKSANKPGPIPVPTKQEVDALFDWKKVVLDTANNCDPEMYNWLTEKSCTYFKKTAKKYVEDVLAQNPAANYRLSRGRTLLTRRGQDFNNAAIDLFHDVLIIRIPELTNCGSWRIRYLCDDFTNTNFTIDTSVLIPKKDYKTVRDFLNECGIETYSIKSDERTTETGSRTKPGSRAIETNEFSKLVVGAFSKLLGCGVVAFESNTKKIMGFMFYVEYSSFGGSCYNCVNVKLKEVADYIAILTDRKERLVSDGDIKSILFPRLQRGGWTTKKIRALWRHGIPYPSHSERDVHIGQHMVKETAKANAEFDRHVIDFDGNLNVYRADDELIARFEMAATSEEI